MDYAIVKVRKYGKEYDCLVSPEDFELVNSYRWHLDKNGYATTHRRSTGTIRMHRLVANTPKGMDTDHLNRVKLDNRRENLRVVTHHLNTLNRPKGQGIIYDADRGKWRSRFKFMGKDIHLGRFSTKEDALMARAFAELFYWDGLRLSAA